MKKTSNLKQPKCKNCKQQFNKIQPLQVACSYSCAIELAKPIAKKIRIRKKTSITRKKKAIRGIKKKIGRIN